MRMMKLGALVAAVCACVLEAPRADAQEIETVPGYGADEPAHRNWALQITPYLWASGIQGDVSPFRRAPTIGIEKSFSEIMEDLNFGTFLDVWGRYDRFVFSTDIMYVNTTDSHAIGALPGVGPTPGLSAQVDTEQFTATLKAGYRVIATPQFTFDVLGGVRIWHVANDVTVNYGAFSRSYGESFGWVDPVVGIRAFLPATEKLSLQAQADIGGFGAGSDLTWQALATVNYAFTDHMSVSAGYKILHVDYSSGGHVFDMTLKGPVLGFTYRF